jgi:5-methylcytosine-specific restriction enzyme subunit McrC
VKVHLTVREHAWLTTTAIGSSTLDRRQISRSAFDWLCKLNSTLRSSGAALVQVENGYVLKLDNYVGVLQTPCGTQIEILPKHIEGEEFIPKSRALLRRMLQQALDLPFREFETADLQLFNTPITEWVMQRFLKALDHLIKRGVRFDYQRIEEEQQFLHGQLNLIRQIRQRPGRQHYFHIRHDVFSPDRPENRLLKLALERVCSATRVAENWRLANELRNLLVQIPASSNISEDFTRWSEDRLMVHYQKVKPWCELVLNRKTPLALLGTWEGISLLFPMEKLFERYVEVYFRRNLCDEARLRAKPASQHLCEHDGDKIFRLEPDLYIERENEKWILDTKWKLLDSTDRTNNYRLSQSDFYQLFAYGRTYLRGQQNGRLVLIYPKRAAFSAALPVFVFSDELSLWVLPFDLETATLEQFAKAGLPLKAVGAVRTAA